MHLSDECICLQAALTDHDLDILQRRCNLLKSMQFLVQRNCSIKPRDELSTDGETNTSQESWKQSLTPFSQQAGDARGWNWKNKTLQHSFLRHLQWGEMVGRMMRSRVPFMLTMYTCKGKTSSVDFPPMQQPLQQPCFHTSPLVSPVTRKELKMAVSSSVRVVNCISTPSQRRSKLCPRYIQHLCRQECVRDKWERKLTADNQDT